MNIKYLIIVLVFVNISCEQRKSNSIQNSNDQQTDNFKSDFEFLNSHTEIILLENQMKGKIAIAPELQARVMTSTANGWSGKGYGWLNKELFSSGDTLDHINAYGGEERFWLGPEGGQYSIFFKKGDDFILDNWNTPRLIDLEPFDVIAKDEYSVQFKKKASLTNYSGFTFNLEIARKISILSTQQIDSILKLQVRNGIKTVGYSTVNSITNVGNGPWTKENGLLSIWILGMYKHSSKTTVVIPYNESSVQKSIVNDDYFGKIPEERLKTKERAVFFKADGEERGKIGLGPDHAKDVLGSYDADNNTLTIVKYNKPKEPAVYVNSKWELQSDPFNGDVINAYNDGPPEPGVAPLGPFYELETSSPAVALSEGGQISHVQHTFHFEGNKNDLNTISMNILGVSLEEIVNAFN